MYGRATALIALALLGPAFAGCLSTDPLSSLGIGDAPGVFSTTDVYEGRFSTDAWSILERKRFDVLNHVTTLVPSELDGEKIMIYVVRPDVPAGTRVPVVLDAGPYFFPTEENPFPEDSLVIDAFVKSGFAFAAVAVRGTGDSGGCMDMMGPAERHDIDQAVTWLGTQEWSNGNVGMFGGSYDGSTQWEAASTGNPHLKTIMPIAGIPDIFEHQVWNGTYMGWTPVQFTAIYWSLYGPAVYNPLTGRSADHSASQVVCPESFVGMAASVPASATGERDPFGFFAARDWKPEILENYRGSIYLIHGFRDATVEPHNAYPFVSELEDRGIIVKHTLGPWGHEMPWRGDSVEVMIRWYERWLKEDPTVDIGPRAQVLDNLGDWRSENAWPPADARATTFFLEPSGGLRRAPQGSETPVRLTPSVPVHDPVAFAQRFNAPWKLYEDPAMEVCADCPEYATQVAATDLRFAGGPVLRLTAVPTGPGGHLTAVLFVEAADGTRDRVTWGLIDLRHGEGDGSARAVTPGEATPVNLQLEPTDVVVPAGSKLVLRLSQGGAMMRMPQTPTYPMDVMVGGTAATLVLDTFERGPEDLHEAPGRVGPVLPPR